MTLNQLNFILQNFTYITTNTCFYIFCKNLYYPKKCCFYNYFLKTYTERKIVGVINKFGLMFVNQRVVNDLITIL